MPTRNGQLSYLEFKQEVALVLIEQEENVAFPPTDLMRHYWFQHLGNPCSNLYQPQQCALDWYSYALAHS